MHDVVQLLRLRDHLTHPADAVARYVMDLDDRYVRGWLAFAGARPVGLSLLYLRQLEGQDGPWAAGYWAHLFVTPEFRKAMIYPQLVLAMIKGAREAGLDMIYTATRRKIIAESHVKLGFRLLGTLRIACKPLRPIRLIAKHKRLPGWLEVAGCPFDAAYLAALSMGRVRTPVGQTIDVVPLDASRIEETVELLRGECRGKISQNWSVDGFRRRFATTIEGWPYTVLAAEERGKLCAAVTMRLAERGDRRVRAGVILDVFGAGSHTKSAAALLCEAERQAVSQGAELMLCLDGTGSQERELTRSLGYRKSPETLDLLGWRANRLEGLAAVDLTQWRFSFADHDAF